MCLTQYSASLPTDKNLHLSRYPTLVFSHFNHSRRSPSSIITMSSAMSIDFLLNPHSKSPLGSHIPASHRCSTCSQRFVDAVSLRAHQRSKHARERPYKCIDCDATFGEKGNLTKHIKSCHQKVRDYACKECSARFSFADGLNRHVAMVHRNERPYTCPDPNCNKSFKQRAHADKHFASVHQKYRPCVCHCGAAFREKYNLRMHQKAVHGQSF